MSGGFKSRWPRPSSVISQVPCSEPDTELTPCGLIHTGAPATTLPSLVMAWLNLINSLIGRVLPWHAEFGVVGQVQQVAGHRPRTISIKCDIDESVLRCRPLGDVHVDDVVVVTA